VDANAGHIVFEHGRTLDITAHRERWGAAVKNGRNVTLGIRPENITISPTETPGAIPGHVYVVQPLGGEWLVVVQVADELLSVRLFQDDEPELEETVWLTFDLDRTFLYDSEGELLE
jgi:ABC-type sugar transport system ATPase subunit